MPALTRLTFDTGFVVRPCVARQHCRLSQITIFRRPMSVCLRLAQHDVTPSLVPTVAAPTDVLVARTYGSHTFSTDHLVQVFTPHIKKFIPVKELISMIIEYVSTNSK